MSNFHLMTVSPSLSCLSFRDRDRDEDSETATPIHNDDRLACEVKEMLVGVVDFGSGFPFDTAPFGEMDLDDHLCSHGRTLSLGHFHRDRERNDYRSHCLDPEHLGRLYLGHSLELGPKTDLVDHGRALLVRDCD